METYLTYADLSARLDVSVNTLRQWKLRGKLPPPDYAPHARVALWKPSTIIAWEKNRGHDEH